MIKRTFDKLKITTSLLGFGTMRFPLDKEGKIEEIEAEKMMDLAISSGVNYIDTAYPYHNGFSEPFVGKVLDKYPRDSYYLATKLPMWKVEKKEDVLQIFEEQLKRLNKEYVDFYLLHALNRNYFKKIKDFDIIDIVEDLRKQGKIKYIGFSFHDDYSVFEEIINYHEWDFCQIQFNYMDTDIQAGIKGYELAKSKNIPVIVMEPIKGGLLAKLPADISEYLRNRSNLSDSSYALRYVASFDNIKIILSGMSTLEHVKDNLDTFINYQPLTDEENERINGVIEKLNARINNGCTGCKYCMPCPKGVNIPGIFSAWNEYGMYQNKNSFIRNIEYFKSKDAFANMCVECGLCEKACPQKLSIREDLKKVMNEI